MDYMLTPGFIFMAFTLDYTSNLMRLCTLGVLTKQLARFDEVSLFIDLDEFLSESTFDDSPLLLESVFSSFAIFSCFSVSTSKIWRLSLLNCSRDFFGEFLGVCEHLRWSWSSAAGCKQKAGVTSPPCCCLLSVAMSSIMTLSSSLGTLAVWIWMGLSIASFKLLVYKVVLWVSCPKEWTVCDFAFSSSSTVDRVFISSISLFLLSICFCSCSIFSCISWNCERYYSVVFSSLSSWFISAFGTSSVSF